MESSVLSSNMSTWRSRGSEKGSFIQKPRGGLWLRQGTAVLSLHGGPRRMEPDWEGLGRQKTVKAPNRSMSSLTQGVELTGLEEGICALNLLSTH